MQVIGSPHDQWTGLEKLPGYNHINIAKGVQSSLSQRLGVRDDSQVLPFAMDTALSNTGYDLIKSMLRWDPQERISAAQALEHPWFDEPPRQVEGIFMPQAP